jgi:hypothetical protein
MEDITNDCIVWKGYKTVAGYGMKHVDGKMKYLHRLEYEKHFGPIPPKLQIDHICFNKSCYNIEHLELVTQQENLRRSIEKERISGFKNRKGNPLGRPRVYQLTASDKRPKPMLFYISKPERLEDVKNNSKLINALLDDYFRSPANEPVYTSLEEAA